MPPETPNTRMPWDLLTLAMGVLSWVGCCAGSCLGMGYLGMLFAVIAFPLGFVGLKDPEANRPMIYTGLALSLLHLVTYVLFVLGLFALIAAVLLTQ